MHCKKKLSYRYLAGLLLAPLLGVLPGCNSTVGTSLPKGYKQVYSESFEQPAALAQFSFTEPAAFQYAAEASPGGSLELLRPAKYEPPVRSPFSIALIKGKQFGSFVLEADIMQTGREYGHQDMCFIFGFQDPSHFYYSHISRAMDDHANQVFIVNGSPRTKISTRTNTGNNWQNGSWHKLRIERRLENGLIRIFFDDMQTPIMEATDTTFGVGSIGFGSFDDTGKIDNIRIWSDRPAVAGPTFFQQIQ